MLAVLAEFERDQDSERTRTAMAHMRNERRRISRFIPYDWDVDANGADLRPNAVEHETVARMGWMRASGLSYRAIATEVDEAGGLTKTGSGAWTGEVRSVGPGPAEQVG